MIFTPILPLNGLPVGLTLTDGAGVTFTSQGINNDAFFLIVSTANGNFGGFTAHGTNTIVRQAIAETGSPAIFSLGSDVLGKFSVYYSGTPTNDYVLYNHTTGATQTVYLFEFGG